MTGSLTVVGSISTVDHVCFKSRQAAVCVEMGKRVLVAIGGNAILKRGEKGSVDEQFRNVRSVCRNLVNIILDGYSVAITHGNGPQVGDIFLKNELARSLLPTMPLDVCVAQSQGMLGYMLQQVLSNELKSKGLDIQVVTVLTQVLVDKNDPAFKNPAKPIGQFYTAEEASRIRWERGWVMVDDSGRGFRRVVPSPNPIAIVESEVIRRLFREGVVMVACGGGGIPVVTGGGNEIEGVEAVVDKDYAAVVLAKVIDAKILLNLTDVEKVALNYGRPGQKDLDELTVTEAERFLAEGYFPPGSMGPKIESAIRFLESGGEKVLITSAERSSQALRGAAGTVIHM